MFPCLLFSCSVLQTRFRVFKKYHMFPYVSPSEPFFFNPCDRVIMFCFLGFISTSSNNPYNRYQYWLARAQSTLLQSMIMSSWLMICNTGWQRFVPKKVAFGSKRSNCRDSPFKRSLKQIWLPPLATCEVSVTADLPTANCFYPEPIPPQILPDVSDSAVQVDMLQQCMSLVLVL